MADEKLYNFERVMPLFFITLGILIGTGFIQLYNYGYGQGQEDLYQKLDVNNFSNNTNFNSTFMKKSTIQIYNNGYIDGYNNGYILSCVDSTLNKSWYLINDSDYVKLNKSDKFNKCVKSLDNVSVMYEKINNNKRLESD